MSKSLYVLVVEESPDRSALLMRELRDAGYEPVHERVDTLAALAAALGSGHWGIVLAGHEATSCSFLAASKLLRKNGPDIPLIVVCDVGSTPLDVVVEGELLAARKRRDRRQLDHSYRIMFEANPLPMCVDDLDTVRFLQVNEAAVLQYGYSREEFGPMTSADILP